MFTGIVEEIGTVEQIQKTRHSATLTIKAATVMEGLKAGDSIAVNGVCLTLTHFGSCHFAADVMHETLNRSALVRLKNGSRVNLERAMPANGRFGGHFVAGHVDGVGKVVDIKRDDTAIWYTIQAGPSVLRYVIEKGSIAVEGISLTVTMVASDRFSVSTIPQTVKMTTLSECQKGTNVNLEVDMIGKYVERLLNFEGVTQPKNTLTKEFLTQCGY